MTTLDDGTEERITPTNRVCARAPDAKPRELDAWFESWEDWTAGVMETRYDASLEWLIDELAAPRGFWGHATGHRYARGYIISRDRA